jgi:hypothetical protein
VSKNRSQGKFKNILKKREYEKCSRCSERSVYREVYIAESIHRKEKRSKVSLPRVYLGN